MTTQEIKTRIGEKLQDNWNDYVEEAEDHGPDYFERFRDDEDILHDFGVYLSEMHEASQENVSPRSLRKLKEQYPDQTI